MHTAELPTFLLLIFIHSSLILGHILPFSLLYKQAKAREEKLESLIKSSFHHRDTEEKVEDQTPFYLKMRVFSKPHYTADSSAIKSVGNKTIFYPRGLSITWGNDSRYWQLPRRGKKDGEEAAELKQVSWLEVTGSTSNNVAFGKKFKVGFSVTMRPDAFGWEGCDVYIMAKIGKKGKFSFQRLRLENNPQGEKFEIPKEELSIIAIPPSDSTSDCRLYFGMYEVWSNRWKGGLKIHHAFVEQLDN